MKALSILAAGLLVASGAMASDSDKGSGGSGSGNTTQACVTCPEINVKAPLLQSTNATFSGLKNEASDGATARQNIASNTGNVNINGATTQSVTISNSGISNEAYGNSNSLATQNIATNIGKVNVDHRLEQYATIASSGVANVARGGSVATQNISTNNGCSVCNK